MSDKLQFVRVDFQRFKALERYALHLRHFNILVGPNNAGKSTILAGFRILSAALRKARKRKPELVRGPRGNTYGYSIDLTGISIAEENIFFNYDDSEPASVVFKLSNKGTLTLYFPEVGSCYLIAEGPQGIPRTPKKFNQEFNCSIGFVPILGPVDHHEPMYRIEAAKAALFNYTASRNFRNIWYHYPDEFDEFRELLKTTWPGMDIEPPSVDYSGNKPMLHMFCPEERIPREIFWAGFGFQVWCQMLTHLVQSKDNSIFLIDEPDIYLHSDLQRQLLGLLRNLGPDVLIATHSTEIITEAESDDIVLINKKRKSSKRITQPSDLASVFSALGSNLNPILTQLAKTRCAVFVEGKDFQILSKFARKIGFTQVANRSDFAVIPVEGFNPEKIKNLISGIETTLGNSIVSAAILDRDYRSQDECEAIKKDCERFCKLVVIHRCKEIENYLLVPTAIDRSAAQKVAEQNKRAGSTTKYNLSAQTIIDTYADDSRATITSRFLAARRRFQKIAAPSIDETTSDEAGLSELDQLWSVEGTKLEVIPGKDAFSGLNQLLQKECGISLSATSVINAMKEEEIPEGVEQLIKSISDFTK
ncbi:MAG: AAA family ATPase [Candidatus Thiodiazotropha taylori]